MFRSAFVLQLIQQADQKFLLAGNIHLLVDMCDVLVGSGRRDMQSSADIGRRNSLAQQVNYLDFPPC